MRIALPNKGGLAERASTLLRESGYETRRGPRELVSHDAVNGVEFFFLRPSDIAVFVAKGDLDAGITGLDLMQEADAAAEVLLDLNFARSSLYFAAPKAAGMTSPAEIEGKRVATSFPKLVGDYLAEQGISATITKLEGAVEVAIKLGVADVIADVVETGSTLAAAGLSTFGEPVMVSEAVLVGRLASEPKPEVQQLVKRLEGVLLARRYVLLDFNIGAKRLEEACEIAPGLRSPTVSTLQSENWRAVRTMVPRSDVQKIMDQLSAIGATELLVTPIQACRL